MELKFTKMHGLGNDFVVIDAINQAVNLSLPQLQMIADRKHGVGCDQVLLVERPSSEQAEFRYRIINSDGSEVAQCGNGARCFARFVRDKQLTSNHKINVETNAGMIVLNVHQDQTVTVNMGVVHFAPNEIPIATEDKSKRYQLKGPDDENISFSVANIGNPHAVVEVDDVDNAEVEKLGAWLESHAFFPERVNVGFMQVMADNEFRLRVFERGVGETRACGSGACAAMAVGRRLGLFVNSATAHLRGGKLQLQYEAEGSPVFMTGPTASVFEGIIEL